MSMLLLNLFVLCCLQSIGTVSVSSGQLHSFKIDLNDVRKHLSNHPNHHQPSENALKFAREDTTLDLKHHPEEKRIYKNNGNVEDTDTINMDEDPKPDKALAGRLGDSDNDLCDKPYLDGCSVPFGLPFFYKTLFTPSCFRHDICYRCGVDYMLNRLQCDDAFRVNMNLACRDEYMDLNRNSLDHPSDPTINARIGRRLITDPTVLIPHKKRVLTALETLRDQFDETLRVEFSEFLQNGSASNFRLGKNFRNRVKFERKMHFRKKGIVKTWAMLLHRKLMSMRNNDNESDQPKLVDNIDDVNPYSKSHRNLTNTHTTNGKERESKDLENSEIKNQNSVASQQFPIISSHDDDDDDDGDDDVVDDDAFASHINFLKEKYRRGVVVVVGKENSHHNILIGLCHRILTDVLNVNIPGMHGTPLSLGLLQDLPDTVELLLCLFTKDLYYWAVYLFGGPSFQSEARSFCSEAFVPDCLPI